jgi:C-terminal processing protease CtpA/Prc
MGTRRLSSILAIVAVLSGCGGGGGSGGSSSSSVGGTATPAPSPTASPTPTSTACTLAARKQWVLGQLNEWYLFPDLLASTIDPNAYSNLDDYVDALVAPARAQSRDRFFTYVTSIKEEDAYYSQGTSAGFGIRLGYTSSGRFYVTEAYEGAPGLAAGLDRGTEIIAIGTSSSNLRTVASLYASGGYNAVSDALGDSTPGTTRVLQIRQLDSTVSTVSVTKRDFDLAPVSSRYGAKVIDDGGRKVGYVNLRTFVVTADQQLRDAFAMFKAQGVTEVIVDLRYNGGGLVSVSEGLSNLLNAQRAGQVLSYTTFRASKASENETTNFTALPQAIAATKVAFIGTGATASASELVINAQKPYLGANAALIGSNTYGKPVGQIALDYTACDDRLRAIAFRTENSAHEGDYYTGLASRLPATCQADDDIGFQLGDPRESSIKVALDFLAGRSCTPIQSSTGLAQQSVDHSRTPLQSQNPTASQRELPGLF